MKINVLAPIYLATQLITLIKESEADIADLMLHILKMPKMIEVSEITINRKVVM